MAKALVFVIIITIRGFHNNIFNCYKFSTIFLILQE